MKRFFTCVLIAVSVLGCKQLEDATPVTRNTFLRFYERSTNYRAQALEVLSDGFLIAGDVQEDLSYNTVITRTDLQGNILWETQIDSTTTNSVLATPNGYLVFGARIQVDPLAEQVNDVTKYKALLVKLDLNSGAVVKSQIIKNRTTGRVDFIGSALTMDAKGNVFGTGSIKAAGGRTMTFAIGIDENKVDTIWFKASALIDRDYTNAKSTFITPSGKILWATSARLTQTKSYLNVPVLTPNGVFVNFDQFGALDDKYYSAEDVHSNAIGYGIIGTYFNTQTTNSNIFFIHTNVDGSYEQGSERYFDGVDIATSNAPQTDKDASSTQDTGDAITSTPDGGFLLAGSMSTTPTRGNGGQDIFLIRMDAFGNVLWNRILGGAGDESVRVVRATSTGDFILCGTSTISGLSSVFLMKINSSGDLKD